MKEIKLGTFFGKDFVIKTTKEDNFDYNGAWENWKQMEKRNAVEEYKDNLFFKDAERKSKEMKKTLWWKIGNKLFN